jgi:hypothetical protein
MKKLLNIELNDEEFDYLICEQSKGKELKIINGKVVAVIRKPTQEDLKNQRIAEIKQRLDELNKDFIQSILGADFGTKVLENGIEIDVFEAKKTEFISLHNELRELEGKEPREYIKEE